MFVVFRKNQVGGDCSFLLCLDSISSIRSFLCLSGKKRGFWKLFLGSEIQNDFGGSLTETDSRHFLNTIRIVCICIDHLSIQHSPFTLLSSWVF